MRQRCAATRTETYRFVVVYIREGREIQGAADVWRGHVTSVPSGPNADEAGSRVPFKGLDELPGILRGLLRACGAGAWPASPLGSEAGGEDD